MKQLISKIEKLSQKDSICMIYRSDSDLQLTSLSKEQVKFVKEEMAKGNHEIEINLYGHFVFVLSLDQEESKSDRMEAYRVAGSKILNRINGYKLDFIVLADPMGNGKELLALAEGILFSNYQYLKHFSDSKKKINSLKSIRILNKNISEKAISELEIVIEATNIARDLVNEPNSYQNSLQLSDSFKQMSKMAGFSIEVLKKSKIESLKMGGILAVNKGSIDEPTFSIMEYKPKKSTNKKPIIFIGKGVVYDTGGLSLKPTPHSMDSMKCDMAGAAAVAGAIYAIAKAKLPIHIISIVPSTDNRPGGDAYAPGDVITMFDGTTVEVMNTDAEGRLILADALSYSKKYKPELVIDLATLTGAAVRAIGMYGSVMMGTADEKLKSAIRESGNNTYERLVEFPLWKEYGEEIKSPIADLKNLGSDLAGATTAGKFLEHFTDYPWLHIDIAGPAFLDSASSYRPKGGTGMGVRLLFDFIKNYK
jgi:leucyl aminopeptidase